MKKQNQLINPDVVANELLNIVSGKSTLLNLSLSYTIYKDKKIYFDNYSADSLLSISYTRLWRIVPFDEFTMDGKYVCIGCEDMLLRFDPAIMGVIG